MRILAPNLVTSLQAARDSGIKPVYFVTIYAKDRDTGVVGEIGLWSGDYQAAVNVQTPEGGLSSRFYFGGANLQVDRLQYVMDLTDNAVLVSVSQIEEISQLIFRGADVRLANVEIHATTLTGGAFTSAPQLVWVGIVDELQIGTPAVGGEGNIGFTCRSEIMSQLTAINPAKSSNEHQKRRNPNDRFSEYASVISSRDVQWYHRDD